LAEDQVDNVQALAVANTFAAAGNDQGAEQLFFMPDRSDDQPSGRVEL